MKILAFLAIRQYCHLIWPPPSPNTRIKYMEGLIKNCCCVGNSSMDTYDGGSTTSWLWTSCQSIIGGVQNASKGNLSLLGKNVFLKTYDIV